MHFSFVDTETKKTNVEIDELKSICLKGIHCIYTRKLARQKQTKFRSSVHFTVDKQTKQAHNQTKQSKINSVAWEATGKHAYIYMYMYMNIYTAYRPAIRKKEPRRDQNSPPRLVCRPVRIGPGKHKKIKIDFLTQEYSYSGYLYSGYLYSGYLYSGFYEVDICIQHAAQKNKKLIT
eukprot:GEMP01082859.1.p1 GENE.GEMP01082859.1~~GEMP01082859.1.p1  ORF type:complete len:177 (-),score=4.13 GEMP01082859.1:112-642(-)